MNVIIYSADSTLVFSNENSIQLELSMNKVMLQLRNWLVINKLTINLLKTSYIIFNKPKLNLIITLDNMIIARSRSIKFLGLIIDDELSWKQQFNNVNSKLYYGIATLRKLSNKLPTYILKLIYYSIFHSHLTYCTHIWGNNYTSKMYVLRIAQNKITRLIFNLISRVNTTSTYINNTIMYFDNIIFYKTFKIMYRVFINDCHINIQNMFQLTLNKYSMRNTNTFILPMIYNNTNKFHTCYYGPVSWNSIPSPIRRSKFLSIFLK